LNDLQNDTDQIPGIFNGFAFVLFSLSIVQPVTKSTDRPDKRGRARLSAGKIKNK